MSVNPETNWGNLKERVKEMISGTEMNQLEIMHEIVRTDLGGIIKGGDVQIQWMVDVLQGNVTPKMQLEAVAFDRDSAAIVRMFYAWACQVNLPDERVKAVVDVWRRQIHGAVIDWRLAGSSDEAFEQLVLSVANERLNMDV